MSSKSFYEYQNVSKTYLRCFRTIYMYACITDYDIGLTSLTTSYHTLRLRCIFKYMCYIFHHPYFYTTDTHSTIPYTRSYIYISPYMIHILHPHDVYVSSPTPPTPNQHSDIRTYRQQTGGGDTPIIAYCIIYCCLCHISCFPCRYMHVVLPFITLHIS